MKRIALLGWVLLSLSSSRAVAGTFSCKMESAREQMASGVLDASGLAPGQFRQLDLVPEYPEFGLRGAVTTLFSGEKQIIRLGFLRDGALVKENAWEISEVDSVRGARVWVHMVSGAIYSYEITCVRIQPTEDL